MHALDADLIHFLAARVDCIQIHDCVGISIYDIHILVDSLNEYYKGCTASYSLHIFL